MAGKTVKRLYDLEIDEISLVDRPANQHGLVAIAKRAEAPTMSLVDEDGYEVTPEELEIGEVVYDTDSGEAFQMVSAEDAAELGYEVEDPVGDDGGTAYDYDDDDEYAGVGKAAGSELRRSARFVAGSGGTKVRGSMGPGRGTRFRAGARGAASSARSRAGSTVSGARGLGSSVMGNRRSRMAIGGAVTAGAAGAGYGYGRRGVSKSLGESVYEELSKALEDGDRDEVISKLGDMVEDANARADQAWSIAKSLQEQREAEDYALLAETYELPVDPREFGPVLARISKSLPERDLALLDRVLSASHIDYDELGYNGVGEIGVMAQVNALASDAVSKSADFTEAQAVTALFEANPAAYDEYLAESR